MSILIKGVKKPKDCDSCGFDDVVNCHLWKIMDSGEIHPECPLVELPEKHGRLIDADAFMDIFADHLVKVSEWYGIDSAVAGVVSGAMKLLDVQPTVIDAEDL